MIVAKVSLRGHRPDGRQPDGHAEVARAPTPSSTSRRRSSPRRRSRRRPRSAGSPLHYLNNVSTSVGSVLTPAGLDNGVGIITAALHQGPDRPAMGQTTRAYEDWVAWMKQVLPERRPERRLQRLRLHRGADAGAGAQAVRRQPDARQRDEAGGQPRHDAADAAARRQRQDRRRRLLSRSSASSWRASTARPGCCSARSTTRAVTDRLVSTAKPRGESAARLFFRPIEWVPPAPHPSGGGNLSHCRTGARYPSAHAQAPMLHRTVSRSPSSA